MSNGQLTQILSLLLLLVGLAQLLGWLFVKLRQPKVVGEILAGVVLGNAALGRWHNASPENKREKNRPHARMRPESFTLQSFGRASAYPRTNAGLSPRVSASRTSAVIVWLSPGIRDT